MKRLYGGGFGDCVRGAIASDATITAVRMPSSPFRHGRMRRKKYKGRYRIASARLRGYDYASAGWYHVVICTHERRPYFGQVRGGIVGLSAVGGAAHRYCAAIPVHADRAVLDAFIVMPNHVHAIIGLLPRPADGDDRDYGDVETHLAQCPVETRQWHVSTTTNGSIPTNGSAPIAPGNHRTTNHRRRHRRGVSVQYAFCTPLRQRRSSVAMAWRLAFERRSATSRRSRESRLTLKARIGRRSW